MTKGITVERQFHLHRRRRNVRQFRSGERKPAVPMRTPRISRLMALAIRFDQLICKGVVTDQAELARLGRVSRARLTQIMNLLNLAPDIQEALLHLPSQCHGRELLSERQLRPIAAKLNWIRQRQKWTTLITRD